METKFNLNGAEKTFLYTLLIFAGFFCAIFYSCDVHEQKQLDLRKTGVTIETCVTHSPADRVITVQAF